jgi:hypothetical protein
MELSKIRLKKIIKKEHKLQSNYLAAYPPPAFFVWLRAQKEIHQ